MSETNTETTKPTTTTAPKTDTDTGPKKYNVTIKGLPLTIVEAYNQRTKKLELRPEIDLSKPNPFDTLVKIFGIENWQKKIIKSILIPVARDCTHQALVDSDELGEDKKPLLKPSLNKYCEELEQALNSRAGVNAHLESLQEKWNDMFREMGEKDMINRLLKDKTLDELTKISFSRHLAEMETLQAELVKRS